MRATPILGTGALLLALTLLSPAARVASDPGTPFAADDERTRIRAVIALRGEDASAVPLLLRDLADPSRRVRVLAAGLLARRPSGDLATTILPTLMKVLADPSPHVRANVALVIGRMGARGLPALPLLRRELAERNSMPVGATARAILEIGPTVEDVLAIVGLLGDADESIRDSTAFHIGQVSGDRSRRVIPLLAHGLEDPTSNLRDRCAQALALLAARAESGPAARGVEALAAALGDEIWIVRSRAAYALGSFGVTARPAEAALQRAARDRDWRVAFEATTALLAIHGDRP